MGDMIAGRIPPVSETAELEARETPATRKKRQPEAAPVEDAAESRDAGQDDEGPPHNLDTSA